jgi:predicted transcriptional regulator
VEEVAVVESEAIVDAKGGLTTGRWADKGERQQPGGEVDCFENNRRYNQIEMPATNSRDRMIEALRELPPDATVDDAIERLVFLAKIEAGLTELDRGEGIPHDEVKRRLGV